MKLRSIIERNPIIMIVIGVLGISLSSIFVKFSTAPSSVTAAYRLLWTVLLLTPSVLLGKQNRQELVSLSRRDGILSIFSGVFLALHFVLWFESLQHTSVASSTTIVCTEVIWVSLGYWIFLKGRLSAKAVLIIAVALVGSVMIAVSDNASGGSHLYGDILALFAAVAVAVYVLIGRVVRERVSTTVYTYVVYASCSIVLLLITAFQGVSMGGYGCGALIVGLLLAVFSTILGHSIFSWCLKYFTPSFVSASKLCEPVAAGILAYFLFGEQPSLLQLAGGVLIISSVYFYSKLEIT